MNAVIGFSLPTYLFWLFNGCSSKLTFYEKADLLGNWAPLQVKGRYFESSCHILSFPSHKVYNRLNQYGFELTRLDPQPCKFDYDTGKRFGYFLNFSIIHKLLSSIRQRNLQQFVANFNLIFNRFSYFSRGSFEILQKTLPNIIKEDASSLEISSEDVRINGRRFSKVFLTPGSVFERVSIGQVDVPFRFTKKFSTQCLIHVGKPNFELTYVRVLNSKHIFRMSRADYSDSNHYLVAGDWNKEISHGLILDFLKRMGFSNSMEVIQTKDICDYSSSTKIESPLVEYIYSGEKNFMNCASQLFSPQR